MPIIVFIPPNNLALLVYATPNSPPTPPLIPVPIRNPTLSINLSSRLPAEGGTGGPRRLRSRSHCHPACPPKEGPEDRAVCGLAHIVIPPARRRRDRRTAPFAVSLTLSSRLPAEGGTGGPRRLRSRSHCHPACPPKEGPEDRAVCGPQWRDRGTTSPPNPHPYQPLLHFYTLTLFYSYTSSSCLHRTMAISVLSLRSQLRHLFPSHSPRLQIRRQHILHAFKLHSRRPPQHPLHHFRYPQEAQPSFQKRRYRHLIRRVQRARPCPALLQRLPRQSQTRKPPRRRLLKIQSFQFLPIQRHLVRCHPPRVR